MSADIADIEARRRALSIPKATLAAEAGTSRSHYDRLIAGHRVNPAVAARFQRALTRIGRIGAGAPPAADLIYRLCVVLMAAEGNVDPRDVLQQDPSRRATSDPQWMKAALVRSLGIYAANVLCGLSQVDLAKVSGMTPAAVSLALRRVEDYLEDLPDSHALGALEAVLTMDATDPQSPSKTAMGAE